MSVTLMIILGAVILILFYFGYAFRKFRNTEDVPQSEKIKILNDKNFNHQVKSGLVMVDFWASWCVPCKAMAPVLNELAEELDEKVKICKLNVDENQQLAVKYAVRSIPTLILFRNGKEIDRFVGVKSKSFLTGKINQN